MKTVLKYYKPFLFFMILNLAFLFGQAMCELALPGYMSDIINNGIVKGDMAYIRETGIMMIVVSIGSMLFAIAGSYTAALIAAKTSSGIALL